jgi:hypothetical protein
MEISNLSVATMSWARDEAEENLLRRALEKLAGMNLKVFVCDGGSGGDFIEFLENLPGVTLVPQQGRGLWNQVKSSLAAAYTSGSEYILYTEPDKLDFFQQGLPGLLEETAAADQAGILLATRTDRAFATFPVLQHTSETTINYCCSEITGTRADYTYGPFLMTRKLVPYLQILQEEIGWGWRPFAFGMAFRLGYRTYTYEGEFECPLDQRADDLKERIYRMRQLSESIRGLVLSTNIDISKV